MHEFHVSYDSVASVEPNVPQIITTNPAGVGVGCIKQLPVVGEGMKVGRF